MTSDFLASRGEPAPLPGSARILIPAFGVLATGLALATYVVIDDHFDRISRARQIVQHGELPFRDFFDPGYMLTLFASAAMQLVFGNNLLGEALLNIASIGAGAALLLYLTWRVSGSLTTALLVSLGALLAVPRPYDYDKFLFYPLAILLAWRYLERPSAGRRVAIAAGALVAGLFRYDNGLAALCAGLTALALAHGRTRRDLVAASGQLLGTLALMATPFLLLLQATGGIVNAVDQVVTYARHEGGRTAITSPPPIEVQSLTTVLPARTSTIDISWSRSLGVRGREMLESRYGLKNGRQNVGSDGWTYEVLDAADTVQVLAQDRFVVEIRGVTREGPMWRDGARLWLRAHNSIPLLRVRLFPGEAGRVTAHIVLYYVLVLLPGVALMMLCGDSLRGTLDRVQAARLSPVLVVAIFLDVFVLRDPVAARIGGMAGPASVIAAWCLGRLLQQRSAVLPRVGSRLLTLAGGVMIAAILVPLSVSADWPHRLSPSELSMGGIRRKLQLLSSAPLDPNRFMTPRQAAMVQYIRTCTPDRERVYAGWYFPHLYMFADRGFAAGLVVTFGGHWTQESYQRRSIAALAAAPPPIVIFETETYERSFAQDYPLLANYFREQYKEDARTDFDMAARRSQGTYIVLVHRRRTPTKMYEPFGVSCFV